MSRRCRRPLYPAQRLRHALHDAALLLRAVPEALLAKMFDGLEHQYGAEGLSESIPGGMSTVPVPRDPDDGSFFIDRHGPSFAYILTSLRDGADAALPSQPAELRQLAVEARHLRLDELTARCVAAAGCTVNSLATLVDECGGGATAAEIAALSDAEVTQLLQDHSVNVLFAKRVRLQVAEERERVRLEAKIKATRLAALGEVERNREILRVGLARQGADLSEAGLLTLVAAGLSLRAVCELDAAAAAALGLSAEDTRLVGGGLYRGVSARRRSSSTTAPTTQRGRAPQCATTTVAWMLTRPQCARRY